VRIRDVDVAAPVGRHAVGVLELSVPRAPEEEAPPRSEESTVAVELLDAVVVVVGHEDIPAPIHGNAPGLVELPVATAGAPPRGEEVAGAVELLDAVVALVGDEDVPAPIHGD